MTEYERLFCMSFICALDVFLSFFMWFVFVFY
jgi:hypothetical protein